MEQMKPASCDRFPKSFEADLPWCQKISFLNSAFYGFVIDVSQKSDIINKKMYFTQQIIDNIPQNSAKKALLSASLSIALRRRRVVFHGHTCHQ